MLSVASLLNPVKSDPRFARLPPSPCSSHYTASSTYGSPTDSPLSLPKKQKMTKDGAVFAKGKIKGDVNFPPYERLGPNAEHEVARFQVYPFKRILEYPRHIPYNSEKKSFLDKTGRESFEVFQYTFKVPGDEKEYTVMWDYNVGLVRITPFFKCCKYSKTTPAKMLNLNPGLKDITHSITGGALAAQGYWMPLSCAAAVCATFCHHIAGALIPIFGPGFPSTCVPPEAPEHGRMIIDKSIIVAATREAEAFRIRYSNEAFSASSLKDDSASPRPMPRDGRHPLPDSQIMRASPNQAMRLGIKRVRGSPYGTDTDMENASESGSDRYMCSPITPTSGSSFVAYNNMGWKAANAPSRPAMVNGHTSTGRVPVYSVPSMQGTNPWLSAVPRSTTKIDYQAWRAQRRTEDGEFGTRSKRRVEEVDNDRGYDGEESANETGSTDDKDAASAVSDKDDCEAGGGAEKKAAWLLMKLSVKDGENCAAAATSSPVPLMDDEKRAPEDDIEGPRVKRLRATSL